MRLNQYEAAVAAFIRLRGITHCPTACASPTEGVIAAADRAALEEYAAARERVRRQRIAAQMQRVGHIASWDQRQNAALHDREWACRR